MKTICRLPNFPTPNVSIYLFADEKELTITPTRTIVGPLDKPDYIILDVNTENCILHEGVVEPSGYTGWKYLYTADEGWVLNPNYRPPEPPEQLN